MTKFIEVGVQEAAMIIESQDPLIIDTRDTHSYRDQHVEGAVLGHDGLIQHLIESKDINRPIIVYCYQGISSKDVAATLASAGLDPVYSMIGGYTAWKKRSNLHAENEYSPATTKWLVEQGFEKLALNTVIKGSLTPLICACQKNEENVALELMAAGADVNARDFHGNTALWAACFSNNLYMIKDLIEVGADINSQNTEGVTALMYAASAGKSEVVKVLIGADADVTLKNKDDFSALDLAVNIETLKLLKNAVSAAV